MKLEKSKLIKSSVILALCFVFVASAIYFVPKFNKKQQSEQNAKVKTDNEIFTSKVLEEFNRDFSAKPSIVAQKVCDELNLTAKNQFDKKSKAFTFDKTCMGCNSVEYDDNLVMVILSTYDKKGVLLARTVIKPPSFVTYTKDEDK